MAPNNLIHEARGALIVDAFMAFLNKEGDGIDKHTRRSYKEDGEDIIVREHIFDHSQGRIIGFTSTISLSTEYEPCISTLALSTNFPLVTAEARDLFLALNALRGHTEMFVTHGPKIQLGAFFGRRSDLRTKITELLELSQDDLPVQVGESLWTLISCNGGLAALREIADDLFEEVIKPDILFMDPYCFDRPKDPICID